MAETTNVYPTLFNVGDIVTLNLNGEKGWIVAKSDYDGNDVKLDIRLQLDDRIIRNISSKDITVINYREEINVEQQQTRSQTTADGISIANSIDKDSTEIAGSSQSSLKTLYDAIRNCFTWTCYTKRNQLYKLLKDGATKPRGWACSVITGTTSHLKSHLTTTENIVFNTISCLFSGYRNKGPELKSHVNYTQHAFGVGRTKHKEIVRCTNHRDTTEALLKVDFNPNTCKLTHLHY